MEYRNAQYTKDGMIDCEINHPEFGWISTTTSESDPDTTDLFAQIKATGNVAPYVKPVIEVTQDQLRVAVNAERNRRVLKGKSFDVSGYDPVRIAGDDTTVQNLQALAFAAQRRLSQGVTDNVTSFRDEDDVIHQLGDSQLLDLWAKGSEYVSACFQAAWTLKDGESIPEDYQKDTYWP